MPDASILNDTRDVLMVFEVFRFRESELLTNCDIPSLAFEKSRSFLTLQYLTIDYANQTTI